MIHEGVGAAAAHDRAIEMLREVKLADAAAVMTRYPHQLSGGQQQRIVIAMALIAEPALLVMDEPTTGLDVTVEAAVLDLLRELRRRRRTAILFISHNLGTVVRVCDRVGVMYRGELVEEGSVRQIFTDPRHPYTRGLLDCLPALGRDKRHAPLVPIPGQLEPALARPPGCGFAARCVHVDRARCTSAPIPLLPRDGARGQRVACVRAAELAPWTRRRPEATAADAAGASDPVISTQRLGKLYHPRSGLFGAGRAPVRALRDVDVVAGRGRTLAIVGESGCGKSTLAKVLAGMEVATDGHVVLDGAEIGGLGVTPRRVPHYDIETYGFRVTDGDRTLAYSGDSAPSDALVDLARDADLFLCEATLERAGEGESGLRGHLAAEEAVTAFERSGAKRLVIIHRPQELGLDSRLERASDGDVFQV